MRNANAAMAGELAPLARQKAQNVIEEGRRLVHIDHRVQQLVTEIEEKLKRIEKLAKDTIDSTQQQYRKEVIYFCIHSFLCSFSNDLFYLFHLYFLKIK